MTLHIWHLVVGLILVCLAWWANEQLAPAPIRTIVRVLIVVVFVLFLLADLGLMGSTVRIGN